MSKVTILQRDGSSGGSYSTYTAAKNAAVSGDLIQIWATLTQEQIILKNGVDIWIAPGVTLDYNPVSDPPNPGPTITDNGAKCVCKIYGTGVIKNTYATGSNRYECILTSHAETELTVQCDYIEGNSNGTEVIFAFSAINIFRGNKFHLTCNKVICASVGLLIGSSSTNFIQDVNLNILKVETGDLTSTFPTTSVLLYGDGFVNIDEILCKDRGHALRHSGRTIIGQIRKITAVRASTEITVSTVSIAQGNGTEKLILYFDEIQALGYDEVASYDAIIIGAATGILIGRRAFAEDAKAVEITAANSKGYLRINEIVSAGDVAMVLNSFDNQITIDTDTIESNGGPVIYSTGSSTDRGNYFIKNAKIKITSNSSSAKGIFLQNIYPIVTLGNVKIISGSDNGTNIYLDTGTSTIVYNYGLFVNSDIQSAIDLKIGLKPGEINYNYQCIVDNEIT